MRALVRGKLADEAEPHRAAMGAGLLGRAVDFDAKMADVQWRGKTVALICALQEECRLVTADDAFVRQLQPVYPFVIALSSMP